MILKLCPCCINASLAPSTDGQADNVSRTRIVTYAHGCIYHSCSTQSSHLMTEGASSVKSSWPLEKRDPTHDVIKSRWRVVADLSTKAGSNAARIATSR